MYIKDSIELKSILKKYDIFFVDIFGVVWDGKSKIKGAETFLSYLKNQGNFVVFISNASTNSIKIEKSFLDIGFIKGMHYDFVVSSGDVAKGMLRNGCDLFNDNKNVINCYIIGKVEDDKFLNGTKYNIVNEINEADFVYVGYPQISIKQYNNLSEEQKSLVFESPTYIERWFNVLDVSFFQDILEECKKYNLPMFSDCADPVAAQVDKKNNEIHYVIGQGTITKTYKSMGGYVVEVCKPHSVIYSYALNCLVNDFQNDLEELKKSKILMIGDTIETDILGATNATNELDVSMDGMLTLCGVSGRYYENDVDKIISKCNEDKLNLNYIIDSPSIIS